MQFWYDILSSPTILITALVIGTFGEITKRVVSAKAGDKGWRGVWYVTLPAHPVIIGLLLGLIPWLPVPEALTKDGYELAGRLGTYALAGIVCKLGYDTLVSTVRRQIGQGAARATTLPGAPSSDPPPPETKP
jgi:H+/Cl- antiporter ClcA